MTPMTKLREELTNLLRTAGITVRDAFPLEPRKAASAPFVLLSFKELESVEGSFLSYLGERYSHDSGEYEEIYGRKLRLSFGFDLYAPKALGDNALQLLMEQLTDLIATKPPSSLSALRWQWGELSFEKGADLFRRQGFLFAEALLYLLREESGRFLSFDVKGGITLG